MFVLHTNIHNVIYNTNILVGIERISKYNVLNVTQIFQCVHK